MSAEKKVGNYGLAIYNVSQVGKICQGSEEAGSSSTACDCHLPLLQWKEYTEWTRTYGMPKIYRAMITDGEFSMVGPSATCWARAPGQPSLATFDRNDARPPPLALCFRDLALGGTEVLDTEVQRLADPAGGVQEDHDDRGRPLPVERAALSRVVLDEGLCEMS